MRTPEHQKLDDQLMEALNVDRYEALIFIGWLQGTMGDDAFYQVVRRYLAHKTRGVSQRELEEAASR